MAVHRVDMQKVGVLLDARDLLSQSGEVGGEDRRCKLVPGGHAATIVAEGRLRTREWTTGFESPAARELLDRQGALPFELNLAKREGSPAGGDDEPGAGR